MDEGVLYALDRHVKWVSKPTNYVGLGHLLSTAARQSTYLGI